MAYQLNLKDPGDVPVTTISFRSAVANQEILQDYCKRTGCKMGALMNSALNDLLEKITEPNTKEASNG